LGKEPKELGPEPEALFVADLAYVLWKTLGGLYRRAGLGDEPRKIFQELSQIKLTEVILPTRNGKEIKLRCVETPSPPMGFGVRISKGTVGE
jgi:hypothetical protein